MAASPLTIVDLAPPDAAEITQSGATIRHLPNGDLELDFDPAAQQAQQAPRVDEENLAEALSPGESARIAQRICEMVEYDLGSREPWMRRWRDGLSVAGIDGQPPAPVASGGAVVVHPLIAEAAIQFQARAMEEVFPAAGPVKALVVGDKIDDALEQAKRVESHMNWQMLEEDEAYFEDSDQMLFVLSLHGSAFKKTYWDDLNGCVRSEYVSAEDVIVPYHARSLRTSPRVTHRFKLDRHELRELQYSGFYLSESALRLQAPDVLPNSDVSDRADGKVESSDPEEDGQHEIYETAIRWKMDGAKDYDDYLITVAKADQRCLSIRKNVVQSNGRSKRRAHFTHYKYLPGLGFYGFGLLHILGGLGKAATDALRASLDAAAASNFQGGFATKEMRALGSDISVKFGTWKVVDATAEDLAKGFYTPPFREPSAATVRLLEMLVATGQRFGSTTEAMVGEGAQSVPVGTTIARIEQASKVYSGIHRRLHRSAAHEFRLRSQLNRERLDVQQQFVLNNSNLVIYSSDYDDRVDVIPVSDPNIASTAQRIQLAEAQLQLARANPAGFDLHEVEHRYLQAIKAPDIDRVHLKTDAVPMLDPVSEGARVLIGQAIKVYPEQDDAAHLAVHQTQMLMLQNSPAAQVALPLLQSHMFQHLASQYRKSMSEQLGVPLPDPGAMKPGEQSPIPPEAQDQIALMAAQAAAAQAQQQAQEPPPDPEAMLKTAQARKTAAEAAEVEARVQAGDQAANALLERAMAQLEEMAQALSDNAARDQEAEQARINLAADIEAMKAEMQAAQAPVDDGQPVEDPVEIRKARIDAEARVAVAERQAVAKAQVAEMRKLIEDQAAQIKALTELVNKIASEEKSGSEHERKEGASAQAAPIPPITIGPIVIERAASTAKTLTIKKNKDGSYTGVSEPDSEDGDDAGKDND